jgi:hypothetical protein
MQFRDWLLSEIHWYSFPPMVINGVEANLIDFHFERYPDDILIDRKGLVLQTSPISAPLDDGTWLNVEPERRGDDQNVNVGQHLIQRQIQTARPDLGVEAPALGQPQNKITIENQPLRNSIRLPRVWFQIAKLLLGNIETKPSEELQPVPR